MKIVIYGLFLIFLALKLAGIGIVATWSWWTVFSPLIFMLSVAGTIGIWTYSEAREKARIAKLNEKVGGETKSKFMQRMEEAIKRREHVK